MSLFIHDIFRTQMQNPSYFDLPYGGSLIGLNNKFFYIYNGGGKVLEFSGEYFTFWMEYFLPTNPEEKPTIPNQLMELHFIFSQIVPSVLCEISQWISQHLEFYWREVSKRLMHETVESLAENLA